MSIPAVRLGAELADRYRVERELGAGGMATVYLAEDVKHRRKVALKMVHPELSAVLGPERFLKEIELTASLQHPHILPLFDSGSADGQLFYVMPYVEGETLRARLEREQQLPIVDAVRVAHEVADALQYAHDRGVIHRDIKPENILLQSGHALVADFGIALAVQQAGGARMTQTGLSLGTPQYMAPEQAMGERAVDARADIYALGAVGANHPRWSADGHTLYYFSLDGALMMASVRTDGEFSVEGRHEHRSHFRHTAWTDPFYDVARDGRVLVAKDLTQTHSLVLVRNWFAELRKDRGH